MITLRTIALAATLALAGCGGGAADDRLSEEEFEQEVSELRGTVESSLSQVASARSQEDVVGRLEEAADEARSAADELAALQPPEEAEEATETLVAGLRMLGDELDQAAQRVEEGGPAALLDAVRDAGQQAVPQIDQALAELERQGFDVGRIQRP